MQQRRKSIRFSFLMTAGLVVVWVLLIGQLDFGTIVFGLLVSIGVQLIFPMPVIPQMSRMRPLQTVWLILVTLWGLVRASVIVSYQVLAWKRPTSNSIIVVDLRSKDSFTSTLTAVLVTLVPGSVVLELRGGRMLVHVFDTPNRAAVEAARKNVLDNERLVLQAFGTKEEVAALRQERREFKVQRKERAK